MLLDLSHKRGDQSPFSPNYRTPISRIREEQPLTDSRFKNERFYPTRHQYKISQQLPSYDDSMEEER